MMLDLEVEDFGGDVVEFKDVQMLLLVIVQVSLKNLRFLELVIIIENLFCKDEFGWDNWFIDLSYVFVVY